MSDLKAQGTKAFIWDFFGKIATHGVSFIVSIFLARLLEPADFGLVAMVMVIITIAWIFGDMGLGAALIQRRRVLSVHYSSVFYFNIIIGALLTLLTFLSAPLIAEFYDNQALLPLTQVISFSFIITAFSTVQITKLRKELNYALLAKLAFISSFGSGILGILLAFYGAGVWSLVVQALTYGLIYNILIWRMSHWKPSMNFSLKALMQLWGFGFRIFLVKLFNTIFAQLDTIIIGKIFPAATLGYFNRAKSLDQMVINYSSSSLISVLFPVLSKVKNDLPRFQNIVIKSLGIIIFVVFLLVGGLYLVSHELIILLFGEKWVKSVEYFKILVLSGFGYPISALLTNILMSRGNSKAYLHLEIYKKIIFGTNLAVGFIWGIEGFLYGLLIATLLTLPLNVYFSAREINLSKSQFMKPIFIQIVITVIVTFFVQFLNKDLEFGYLVMFFIKGSEYVILYIMLNKILNTDAYKYFNNEAKPIYNKLLNKMGILK